ncbi:hypothetical protein PoB_007267500 [Plakobranchus ocellatus]|uniref:Uncharacterized protein n=1 Tax=Plakobranchus ocellatus TaxID=259542 RepID=A0AAV4DQ35_9GAST|nr:hypothetical protein PoB_007267500 [Plakobranchus ocellatus]
MSYLRFISFCPPRGWWRKGLCTALKLSGILLSRVPVQGWLPKRPSKPEIILIWTGEINDRVEKNKSNKSKSESKAVQQLRSNPYRLNSGTTKKDPEP